MSDASETPSPLEAAMAAAQRRQAVPRPDPPRVVPEPAPEASPPEAVEVAKPQPLVPKAAAAKSAEPKQPEPEWQPGEHDLIPLLPRGRALFDSIPAPAVVLDALCPAVGHGALIVRRPESVGVVLVREGAIFEKYAFADSTKLLGDNALQTIASWRDALVSAYQFDPEIVEVLPSLLRGAPCYLDLRLNWADWDGLLADLCDREGSYVVELDTPKGRGVTCIHGGRQIATFTQDHPEFGEASLLDPLAATRRGTIWVWRQPSVDEAAAAELSNANTPSVVEPAETPAHVSSSGDPGATTWPQADSSQAPFGQQSQPALAPYAPQAQPALAPFGTGAPDPGFNPFSQPSQPSPGAPGGQAAPFADIFGGRPAAAPPGPATNGAAGPGGQPAPEVIAELKLIARQRLQRSAAKVEGILDEVVNQGRPLDAALGDIRGLVIRGVMQSTLDQVVDEMMSRVRQLSG